MLAKLMQRLENNTADDAAEELMEDAIQLLDRKPGLYLRHTEKKGRGLFCMYPIKAGEELEVTPAIILNEVSTTDVEPTILRDYVFKIGDVSEELLDEHDVQDADETSCVVMGIASYCNDDVDYNAEVVYQEIDGTLYYTLQAVKDIPANTEICTSYGENWFQDRDMEEEHFSETEDEQNDDQGETESVEQSNNQ